MIKKKAKAKARRRQFASGKIVPKKLHSMYDAMIKHGAKVGGYNQCIIQKQDKTYVSVSWTPQLECVCDQLGLNFIGGVIFLRG